MFWTVFLLLLAGASSMAWLLALMLERDVHPVGDLAEFFRRRSNLGRFVLGVLFVGMWIYAGLKPGDGMLSTPPPVGMSMPGDPELPSVRPLSDDDYAAGIVLARIGVNETWDFSPPDYAESCDDWQRFGAACDWFRTSFGGDWRMVLGNGVFDSLTVFSHGMARPVAVDADVFVSPFHADLGIVPAPGWDGLVCQPSRHWRCLTPSNTFVMTWQNVLLGRDPSRPVSFQAEIGEDGTTTFRYDLSRLPCEVVSNVLVGVRTAVGDCVFTRLARATTSLRWARLDPRLAADPDPDGDGVPTEDEVFTYFTDPYRTDTDMDGLSDGEEIGETHTDPLNPHSVSPVCCDGVAVKIGNEDPFSCPPGSTNTVWEHVFYSGTTNGVFSYPRPYGGKGLMTVTVSGSGSGELIVGDSVVPLLGTALSRGPLLAGSGSDGHGQSLVVQVAKGEDVRLHLRGDDTLTVELDADEFAFGELPTWEQFGAYGFVNFPNTEADAPCIHDFNTRERRVTLPVGGGASVALLTCNWQGSGNVEIENEPPRAAMITGNFSAREAVGITYTLNHPQYLFGRKTYNQNVCFCPRPPSREDNPDVPDEPDPYWFSQADGENGDGLVPWCCVLGTCCDGEGECDCECGEDCAYCFHGEDDPIGDEEGDEEDDELCDIHECPYPECAYLHYTNAVATAERLGHVLYIRNPTQYVTNHLVVPTQFRNCCSCPEHRTNYVAVAYMSRRLRLVDENGLDFRSSGESCNVMLAGVYPSAEIGDAELAFARNGEIYQRQSCTVLGVAIESDQGVGLQTYNALSRSLGYPFTVNTNLNRAASVRFVTNVQLRRGTVHVGLENVTGQFTLWYYDYVEQEYRRLLDSTESDSVDMTIGAWRNLHGYDPYGNAPDTRIYITSATNGSAKLVFRYWNETNGKFVEDEAEQKITSLNPPLLPDINRDGMVDEADIAIFLEGRPLRFWTNDDIWRNNDGFSSVYDDASRGLEFSSNGQNMYVDGRNDLVNLLPLAVNVGHFLDKWNNVTVKIRASVPPGTIIRYCCSSIEHLNAGELLLDDTMTAGPQQTALHDAILTGVTSDGVDLDCTTLGGHNRGFVLVEAVGDDLYEPLELVVKVGGNELYSYRLPLEFHDVDKMYRWCNLRHCASGTEIDNGDIANSLNSLIGRPDSECDGSHVVFVHGYNVNEREARLWGRAVFKRLWWAGMDSAFTVVAWRGDESQAWYGPLGWITPDYQVNVEHAFATANNLATMVNALPGEYKYVMAHSLGNMLVSSAVQDFGLQYVKYFMVNAAVPVEAYDMSESAVNDDTRSRMTPEEWIGYPDRVKAAHWYELFPVGDSRRGLTWKGRFGNVINVVNYYSPEDEVLTCGNGETHFPFQRNYAWYNQERYKGTKSLLQDALSFGRNEGGWEFNDAYKVRRSKYDETTHGFIWQIVPIEPADMDDNDYPDSALKEIPFFGPFENNDVCTTNAITEISAAYRAQLLADAIPAESLVAGFTAIPNWMEDGAGSENVNMASDSIKDVEMRQVLSNCTWIHSFFVQVPYCVVHGLYEDIVTKIKSFRRP